MKYRKITEKEALQLFEDKVWESMSVKQRGESQLFTDRLFMPFDLFHEGVEELLGRPVWTHEFAAGDLLRKEANTGKYQNSLTKPLEKAGFIKPKS